MLYFLWHQHESLALGKGVMHIARVQEDVPEHRWETIVHSQHLACRQCGRSVEVEGRVVEQWAEKVAAEAGFTAVDHTVELVGLCPEHSAATD